MLGGGGIGSLRAVCMIGEQCLLCFWRFPCTSGCILCFGAGAFRVLSASMNDLSNIATDAVSMCCSRVVCMVCQLSIPSSGTWYLSSLFSHGKLTANFLHEIKCRTAQFRVTFFQFIDEGWTFKVGKQK